MSQPPLIVLSDPMDATAGGEAPLQSGMTEDELLAIVRDEITEAVGWVETTPEQRRSRLLRRYLGEKYGNEQAGYSQVVSRDVYEVVEWALPQLVETFLAGDKVARFDPVGPEDEDEAKQQTDLANHVFLKENNGFLLLTTAFKDALIQEIGVLKATWEQSRRAEYEYYESVTEEQIALYLANDPNVKISAAMPSQFTPGAWDVELRRTFGDGKLVIEGIPPEEFFYSSDARDISSARIVGHRVKTTASKMIDMGYDPEVVAQLSGDSGGANTSGELARIAREDASQDIRNNRKDSERQIDLYESWILVDFDGDGISELRKVCVAGNGTNVTRLLYHEPAMMRPFAVLSPILMPHRMGGISLAETVEDIAEIRTAIMRAYLNALYLAQRPRTIVLGDPETGPLADVDEIMSVIPGGLVTEYAPQAIRPFPTEDVSASSLTGLELMRGMREERTGITRTWQGMEAPNKLNDTASGMQMLTNAAGKRLAFIGRIFAETGVKRLFNIIAALLKQHQRQQKTVRLRGEWRMIDPTNWRHDYDATVEVGLGYGDKEQSMLNMQMVQALQEKFLTIPGISHLVTPVEAFESTSELLKNMGYKNAERFFKNPATTPAPPPEPSIDEKKLQQEFIIKQMELEVRELDLRLEYEIETQKLKIEAAKLGIEFKRAESEGEEDEKTKKDDRPAIHMDLGLGPVMKEVESLKGDVVDLRSAMTKPRRVVRDNEGRIVGSEVAG